MAITESRVDETQWNFASEPDPEDPDLAFVPSNNGQPTPAETPLPFDGLTHAQVLDETTPDDTGELVEDLVEAGVVGDIAGVPESHKSWLAQALAIRVAAGTGEILGHPIKTGGPVGYFWQDDSRRNEIDRIKLFESVHTSPPGLPLRWYLNEGLELPRDLHRLRATVEQHGFVLVILDSFYNVATVDVKDTDAGDLIKQLKTLVTDPTGCTILIVDHMAWATDVNRGRLRSYGSVIKNAAARFHILIDAEKDKLWIEARGNNIKGFKRTPASWDTDTLELRLLDDQTVADDEYEQRILDYLEEHPWSGRNEVIKKVEGKAVLLRETLKRLIDAGTVQNEASHDLGRPGRSELLAATKSLNQATLRDTTDRPDTGTPHTVPMPHEAQTVPPSLPCKGDGLQRDAPNRDAPTTTDEEDDDDIPF